MSGQQKGRYAEAAALNYLQRQGLKLVTKNFTSKLGEIDLIMIDSSTIQARILVFVEVRYRQSSRFGGAAASIGPVKQKRIRRTADWFLATHAHYRQLPCRFDVVAMGGSAEDPDITWLPCAFNC